MTEAFGCWKWEEKKEEKNIKFRVKNNGAHSVHKNISSWLCWVIYSVGIVAIDSIYYYVVLCLYSQCMLTWTLTGNIETVLLINHSNDWTRNVSHEILFAFSIFFSSSSFFFYIWFIYCIMHYDCWCFASCKNIIFQMPSGTCCLISHIHIDLIAKKKTFGVWAT